MNGIQGGEEDVFLPCYLDLNMELGYSCVRKSWLLDSSAVISIIADELVRTCSDNKV